MAFRRSILRFPVENLMQATENLQLSFKPCKSMLRFVEPLLNNPEPLFIHPCLSQITLDLKHPLLLSCPFNPFNKVPVEMLAIFCLLEICLVIERFICISIGGAPMNSAFIKDLECRSRGVEEFPDVGPAVNKVLFE